MRQGCLRWEATIGVGVKGDAIEDHLEAMIKDFGVAIPEHEPLLEMIKALV